MAPVFLRTKSLLFSAGPNQPRLGLGLSMVREVVSAHAGHLEIHSDTSRFNAEQRFGSHCRSRCDPAAFESRSTVGRGREQQLPAVTLALS